MSEEREIRKYGRKMERKIGKEDIYTRGNKKYRCTDRERME
jgi:hypothetical protein